MSPLWSGKNTKQSDYMAKPSPTYCDLFPDSAQDPGSFTNSKNEKNLLKYHFIEERLLLTSQRKVPAGMTVEAAILLPLFLSFVLSMGSIIEMIRLHGNMQLALWNVGNQAAVYMYAVEKGMAFIEVEEEFEEGATAESKEDLEREEAWWEELLGTVVESTLLKWQILDEVGETYLDYSPVVGGSDGILLLESDIVKENGEMELVATYAVEPLFNLLGVPYFRMVNRYYGHTWTGYRLGNEQEEPECVYITDNAEVFHLYRDCTHLLLTIRAISVADLAKARNLYGARYGACEKCADGAMPMTLIVAEEGDCYHYVRTCSGLKRTVHAVIKSDVTSLPLCSRCSARGD